MKTFKRIFIGLLVAALILLVLLLAGTFNVLMTAKKQAERVEQIKARQPADLKFIDFAADYQCKTTRLSDYVGRGQYVLADFWASWCGPCRAAIPKIKKFYAAHCDRLTVISASVDEKRDNWVKAVKQEAMPWTQLWLTGKNMEKAGSAYVINSIPRLVLIAPDGKIVKVTFDPEEIFKAILAK